VELVEAESLEAIIYNTMLNFISVSFCTAYIIITFRVRVRVRVSFRVS